jgi:hypothetical protein
MEMGCPNGYPRPPAIDDTFSYVIGALPLQT